MTYPPDADVYQQNELAGHIFRTDLGTQFLYTEQFLQSHTRPVATTLPLREEPYTYPAGALAPFFTGLLPEGRRLTALKNSIKASSDDELSLLLAVGEDTVGDIRVLPHGVKLPELHVVQNVLSGVEDFKSINFTDLLSTSGIVDESALPGVQEKVSGKMLTLPLQAATDCYFLKLNPPEYSRVVENESFFLSYARRLKSRTGIAQTKIVTDAKGRPGLLIKRFDRGVDASGKLVRYAVEDACQVLNKYPADKYNISAEEVCIALSQLTSRKVVARQEIFRQFVYAWLTGNGDLHAKNLSIITQENHGWELSPVHDIPSTAPYGDNTMALTLTGKRSGLSKASLVRFAYTIGLREPAAERVIQKTLKDTQNLIEQVSDIGFDSHRQRQLIKTLKNRRRSLQ